MTSMKREWAPDEKIVLWGAGIAALAVIAYWIVVLGFQHGTAGSSSAVAASQPGRVVGVFAASIEELRARNHVTLIPTSETQKTFAQEPAGSYGFVFAPYIAHSAPRALEMYTHNDPSYFEVHKLSDNQAYFVGYVGPETQERLQKGLVRGEKLTLYSSQWPKAPNLTAILFGSVKCARTRDMAVRRKEGAVVLFALDCKAI